MQVYIDVKWNESRIGTIEFRKAPAFTSGPSSYLAQRVNVTTVGVYSSAHESGSKADEAALASTAGDSVCALTNRFPPAPLALVATGHSYRRRGVHRLATGRMCANLATYFEQGS